MSYPMVSYDAVILRSKSMPNFTKAQALVNWIYWTQTNSLAAQIARAYVREIAMTKEGSHP